MQDNTEQRSEPGSIEPSEVVTQVECWAWWNGEPGGVEPSEVDWSPRLSVEPSEMVIQVEVG